MYQEAGTLLLASRLKRLGDRLFSEITKVYKSLNLGFEPSWFPIFYLLNRDKSHSVSTIAREAGVTDSAVSQLIKQLREKKLIRIVTNVEDKRAGAICLSSAGEKLLETVKPVWNAIEFTLEEYLLSDRYGPSFLDAVLELENSLDIHDLSNLVKNRVEFCHLEKNHTLSCDTAPHSLWIKNFLLTFTIKSHPNWPGTRNILANMINNTETSHQVHLLLDNGQPVALLISSGDQPNKRAEQIVFCASQSLPGPTVEDFFIMKYCQSLTHTAEVSVHYDNKNFLSRLQKLGFVLKISEEKGQHDYLDFVYNPTCIAQE